MACCGQKRAALRTPPSARRTAPEVARVIVEYAGTGPVLEIGAVTGLEYHFAARGARVAVDLRDVAKVLSRGDMRRR